MTRYAVHTLFANGKWGNAWHDDEEVPTTFDTREDAEADLSAFIDGARYAFSKGYLSTEYKREDYRIVEVEE